MDLSTSMEIGYILITLLSLLLLGGSGSMTCSLMFQPNTTANSVYAPKKKLIEPKGAEIKQPVISDYFDDDESVELEINGDLFDD